MKKIYLTLLASLLVFFTNGYSQERRAINVSNSNDLLKAISEKPSHVKPMAAIDTITNHWDEIYPNMIDTPTIYSSSKGFIVGQNNYEDIAKAQKFDSNFGITSDGTIKALLFWFGGKIQSAGTAEFVATIWADNSGVPGAVLGQADKFTVAQIDTSASAYNAIGSSASLKGTYNVTASFTTPVIIPSNKTFWAGFTCTYAAGDSAGLITSRDGVPEDAPSLTGNFPEAETHTFEQWNDNTWHSFNDGTQSTWQLDIALGLYPVVDFSIGIKENTTNINRIDNYPNPASETTSIYYDLKLPCNVELSICDLTGKELLHVNEGKQASGAHTLKTNISMLSSGMYLYTLSAGETKITKQLVVSGK